MRAVLPAPDRLVERVTRCMFGLVVFGIGVSLIVHADLGASPWDIFHQGLGELLDIPIGTATIGVGILLLLLWIPLRQRLGIGTVLNAIVIGLVMDVVLAISPDADAVAFRLLLVVVGLLLTAIGSGFYIGAGLGPGPRDGLMTGVAARGVFGRSVSIRTARTGIELIVLVAGVALGGTIGVGTAMFAFGIGPLVQVFLPRLTVTSEPVTPVAA